MPCRRSLNKVCSCFRIGCLGQQRETTAELIQGERKGERGGSCFSLQMTTNGVGDVKNGGEERKEEVRRQVAKKKWEEERLQLLA